MVRGLALVFTTLTCISSAALAQSQATFAGTWAVPVDSQNFAVRADPDGTITAANAGHISPYLQGREIPLDTGLPLGLVADVHYTETAFHLAPGEQLTLLTDGVVEARSHATSELFGFDRTAALSTQHAEAIAATAQQFGQDDDITVLTLARQA